MRSTLSTTFSLVILALLGLSATVARAGDKFFDFNSDPTKNGELKLYGTATWIATGGSGASTNANDGYLSVTDALNGQKGIIVFSDADNGKIIQAFSLTGLVRIGGGTDRPADGFSVNYARADDPVVLDPANGAFATGPNDEANLPEEGTQTGLAVEFDAWDSGTGSGGHDIVGIGVRVDNVLLTQVPMPDLNGACGDLNSLQTGLQDANNPGSPDLLCWQPFSVVLDTNGLLTVTFKSRVILTNFQTSFFASAGQIILAGRTGGANENHHVDNLHLITIPANEPIVAGAVGLGGAGFILTMDDSGNTVVTNTIAVKLNGTSITPNSITKGTNGITTVLYFNPDPASLLAPGSTGTVTASFTSSDGKAITGTRSFVVPPYVTLPTKYATPAAQVDTTSSGFIVRTFQMDARQGPGDQNSIPNNEELLVGGYIDTTTGAPFPNTASTALSTNDLINFDINGADIGTGATQPDHFNSLNNYPNALFPGIPGSAVNAGANASVEDFACEITAFINLKKGYYRMGVNSDDGFTVSVAPGQPDDIGLMLGNFPTGRGAADTKFDFAVTQDGIFPIRLSFWQGTGGGNLEWWTQDLLTGAYYLVNDRSNSKALVTYSKGHARGHLQSISPYPGFAGAQPTNSVVAVFQDDLTAISGITMTFDGATVTPTINKSGNTTTVTYHPPKMAFESSHTGTLIYQESTTPPTMWTNNISFQVRLTTPADLPAVGSFWIEAEDWDINGGQSLAVASVMPYAGGAYTSSGTDTSKFDIDYHNDDNKDTQAYRSGGDLDVAGQNVDAYHNSGGRFALTRPGGFTMTDNWTIGWSGSPDWGNFTRTIPTNVYNVYAALSWGGDPPGTPDKELGSLELVTSGWGTKNQSVLKLGTFDGASSGTWGSSTLVKMKASDGSDAVVKLGGTNTLRFHDDSGDFDWFVLTPAVAPAKVLSASPTASVHGEPRSTPINVNIANLSTKVVTSTIKLTLNGVDVTSASQVTTSPDGNTVTVRYQPAQLLALGNYTYTLTFSDNGTPPGNVALTNSFFTDPRGTPGQFLIEAEDFDSFGTNVASATTMPYLGGAYDGLSAKFGVDYVDKENQDNGGYNYRIGGDLAVKGQGANIDSGPGDFNRGSWTNTVNHKIGWIGSDDWYNYTRTFPTNNYQVWAALSWGGDPAGVPHKLLGSIALVTSGVGTTNQTVQVLGTCDGPSTAAWGLNNLVQMTDTNGMPIVVPLGGKQTVQYQGNSGDYDYLLFVPGTAPLRISNIQVSGTNLKITWDGGGTLESVTVLGGIWAAVPGNPTSPATVPIGTNKTLYFRIKK